MHYLQHLGSEAASRKVTRVIARRTVSIAALLQSVPPAMDPLHQTFRIKEIVNSALDQRKPEVASRFLVALGERWYLAEPSQIAAVLQELFTATEKSNHWADTLNLLKNAALLKPDGFRENVQARYENQFKESIRGAFEAQPVHIRMQIEARIRKELERCALQGRILEILGLPEKEEPLRAPDLPGVLRLPSANPAPAGAT